MKALRKKYTIPPGSFLLEVPDLSSPEAIPTSGPKSEGGFEECDSSSDENK